MKKVGMFTVAVDDKDIIVRVDRELIDETSLRRLLDYIELEAIRKRSKLTEEKAARLAQEVDRAAWESSKPKFLEE